MTYKCRVTFGVVHLYAVEGMVAFNPDLHVLRTGLSGDVAHYSAKLYSSRGLEAILSHKFEGKTMVPYHRSHLIETEHPITHVVNTSTDQRIFLEGFTHEL